MMHQSFLSRQSQQTIADNFDKPPISSHHFYHVSSSDDNGNSEAHRQALLHLGFDEEAVDDLYASKKHRGASLEELVMQLSATRMDERKEGSNDDFYIQEKLRLQANSNPSFGNPHGQVPIYLLKYAEDAAISDLPELEEYLHSASTNGESSAKDSRDNSQVAATVRCHEFAHDMQLKFSMAESVLDTFGPVEEHDPGDGVADLVEWATSMACLNTEIQAAYFEGIPFREMRFTHSEGLYQLFRDLERIRLAIDKDSTHGGILSDAEMWRMEELDMIASIGTEDEQILHRLFRRNDELTAELNMLHKRFRVMIATDRGVKRENLEELYLFLKEQISNGTDLDIVSDELNDHVFSLIPANRSGEVVDMLLNMHLFEDEQMLVKDKIHSLVGSPNKIAGNSLLSDDAMGKEYDVNRLRDLKIYGESSTSRIDAKANSFTSSDIADGKSTNTLASIERPYSLIAVDDPFKDDNEKLLSEVKSNHKSMLANLQLSLEQQKEAKLRDLEQKLLRRKAQRNRLQKEKDASKTTSEEDESMIDSLDLDIAELDQRIAGIVDYFKEVEEHMAIGLRKRCVLEAKAIKTTAATNSGKCRILSEEEKTSVNREAANLLKNQYERDQLSLLDALSAERERQRKKILQRLANRKSNGESDSGSKENGDEYFREYEEAAIQELAEVNRAFDQEEVAIMTASHNKSLLALAAVQINSTLLVESNLVEADDDYFGDENADHKELGSEKNKWWGTVELLRNEYTKTGRNLHLHLQKTYQQDAAEQDRVAVKTSSTNNTVNDENSCEGNVFNEITTQMINVVTNAFHRDLEELQIWKGNDLLSNFEKNSNTKTQDNLANNILLEFEKAEGKFDRVLEIAQQKSREKLRERQRQRSGYCYGKAEESMISNGKNDVSSINISCMLKKAVEEFLLDPTTIPQNDNAKSNTSFDQTIKKLVNYPKETLRRDDKGSIEVDDFEKSFDLDKDRLKAKYTETEQKQVSIIDFRYFLYCCELLIFALDFIRNL